MVSFMSHNSAIGQIQVHATSCMRHVKLQTSDASVKSMKCVCRNVLDSITLPSDSLSRSAVEVTLAKRAVELMQSARESPSDAPKALTTCSATTIHYSRIPLQIMATTKS